MSLFFRAKLSCVFLTFILTSQIEGKCQISLLSTQPKLFSPLQWSDLGIFHLSPGYFLIFFPFKPPHPVPIHWVGYSPGIFQPAPTPRIFCLGGNFSVSFSRAPLSVQTMNGWTLDVSPGPPSPVSFLLEGGRYPAPPSNKTESQPNMGDSRTRRDLPKFVCIP